MAMSLAQSITFSVVNVVTDPAQIATAFFPQCSLERYLDQHTKNALKFLLGKYVKFA